MTAMSGLPLHKKRKWKTFNHTKYQQQPGRAETCDTGCKRAIVAWPPLSKRTLLNPQPLLNRARTSKSKVAIVFLKKKKMGVLSTMKF
jgi:hypothetical protein